MDIHEYFGVLRRGWALIVLGLLVGIAGGVAANAIQPRMYSATSREILTTGESTGDLTQSLQASTLAGGKIASYVLVATSGLVLQPVIDELKLDTTVQQLASQVSVVAPPNTLIVEITATAATPALAKSIANTVSSVFSDVIENQIENAVSPAVGATDAAATDGTAADGTDAATTAPVRIVNIEHASLPTGPTLSNAPLLLGVGGILGLALGLVAASLRESLDRRIRSRKDVAAVSEQPVLGQVRPDRGVKSSPIVMHTSSQSAIAESFRGLRASVEHVRSRDDIATFVITAVAPRQGSSLVAANLALAIADTSTSVVVVDANLAAPYQAEIFDVDAGPGLTDLLTTAISLDEVIVDGPGDNLWIVPIGSRRAGSADLLATPRMRALLTELRGRFDVVIIDTPAISTATDAAVLGSFGAATLLVAAEGTATRPALADALGALAAGGSVPAGIVLNRIPRNTRKRRPKPRAAAPATRRVVASAPAAPAVPPPVLQAPPIVPAAAPVAVPETVVVDAPEILPDPVIAAPVVPVVPTLAPPVVETTSARAAARAARVAAKAAARAAASRPQEPVSRFAPKPVPAPEFPLADRAPSKTPIIDSIPVLEPVYENSDSVIDVPRGDTGERVTLLTPQPGDPTPEELAEIIANQFKDDVVYEIPAEAFGSFHLVDADAFAAVDNEPTILPAARLTAPLTEENAAFVIDLLADEAVYSQPRFEDWAAATPAAAVEDSEHGTTEPEFDASVYDISERRAAELAPVYEIPLIDPPVYEAPLIDPPVYEIPVIETAPEPIVAESPITEPTTPRPFVAPETWPAPRLVANPPAFVEEPVEVAAPEPTAEVTPVPDEDTAEAPVLARVTALPTRERLARESYVLKSRELERAAQERLRYEQERLEARIREQLEADRRQLAGKLDELLEDTVMLPRKANEG